jgi:hypothetical protein
MGDMSQKDWHVAPEWQRDSAINGVGFIISNPTATPKEVHEGWKKQKIAEGWTYGPVKDEARKEHHCIVEDYNMLPLAQRVKDNLFRTVVLSLCEPTAKEEDVAIQPGV